MSFKWTGSLGLAVVAALSGACGGGGGSGGGGGIAATVPFWFTVHPVPTPENLRAVRFNNAAQGLIAGETTTILRTGDGGATWVQQEHVPQSRGGDIVALDASGLTVHAAGSDASGAKIWSTSNSVNWITEDLPGSGSPFTSVDIFAPDSGSAPAIVYYLRLDGTLERRQGPAIQTADSGIGGSGFRIDMVDLSGIGYVAGSNLAGTGAEIRRTDNFGATASWGPQTLTADRLGVLRDLSLGSFNLGYACGDNSTILYTLDGVTWTDADPTNDLPAGIVLRGIHFPVSSSIGWVVGNLGSQGHVWKTTDGGANWVQQAAGVTPEHLYDVWFVDDNTGYAVGDKGVVLKTVNGGTLWVNIAAGKRAQMNAVDFTTDGQRGLAVGNVLGGTGIILRSLDGGATWGEYTPLPPVQDYHGVSIPKNGSRNVAYVCGAAGTILRNADFAGAGGWTAMTSNVGANPLRAILFPDDDDHGVCAGDGDSLVYIDTATSSLTWTAAPTKPGPAADYKALSHVRNGATVRVYAGGTAGRVAGSLFPTSAIWTTVGLPAVPGTPTVQALQSGFDPTALPAPADVLFAAGSNITLNRLQIGGAWTSPGAAPGAATAANGLAFINPLFGWWVSNGVYTTVDGGATWTPSPDHTTSTLRAVWMSAAGLLGATVGDNGIIQMTTNGGK